jgi:hypothetical protein
MTWPDVVVIALCILLGVLESKRGFVVAICDMLGAILVVGVAGGIYLGFVSPSMSYCAAYLTCVGVGVVIVGVATTLLKRQAQTDIGSFDNSLASLLGVVSALVLSHALYGAVILAYGRQSPEYAGSGFAGQIYDLNAWHGFMGFMGKIGTTDIVK